MITVENWSVRYHKGAVIVFHSSQVLKNIGFASSQVLKV